MFREVNIHNDISGQGYCQLDNVISKKNSLSLLSDFKKTCVSIAPEYFSALDVDSWESEQLSVTLIALRKNDKKMFSEIYDSMLKSSAIRRFCFASNLNGIAENVLGVKNDELCVHGLMLRMDVPYDQRNLLGWHQDSCYDGFNAEPASGCVLWVPLVDVGEVNGGLILMPGSHVEGNVCEDQPTDDMLSTRQLIVPDRYVEKYQSKSLTASARSCVVSYSNIFHKSGRNVSTKVRFTFIVRFNKRTN